MPRLKSILLITLPLATLLAGISSYPTIAFQIETRHFAPDYIAWKYHSGPCPPSHSLTTNLVRDHHRDDLVVGRSHEDLQYKFGNLHREPQTEIQNSYEEEWRRSSGQPAADRAWIADTQWLIEFQSGRATHLRLIKG